MKKLLVIAVAALMTSTAFAQKHMVRFYGWDDGATSNSFDVSFDTTKNSGGTEDANSASNKLFLNYAYALNNTWQVGLTYKNENTGTNEGSTIGLSAYWNKDGNLLDTCYFAFHYDMMSTAKGTYNGVGEDDSGSMMTLEYGHRFNLGKAWGFNLTYSPSVALSQSTIAYDADGSEDQTTSALAWNWLKFDLLF
jgi:hypothetical protein